MSRQLVPASEQEPLNVRLSSFDVACRVVEEPTTPPSSSSSSLLHSSSAQRRSLVATRAFEPGTTILQSTPHAFVLTPIQASTNESGERVKCEWCGLGVGEVRSSSSSSSGDSQRIDKLSRCSTCKMQSYCSITCQRLAWKDFHSFECKTLWSQSSKLKLFERLASEAKLDLILLGRCVRKRGREETALCNGTAIPTREVAGAPLTSTYEDLEGLESHYPFLSQQVEGHSKGNGPALAESTILGMAQRMTDNAQLLSIGLKLGLFGPTVTPDHVFTLLMPILTSFQSNNFAITNSLLLTTGAGVYPIGALLNHSCEPNCVITYETIQRREAGKDNTTVHTTYHHVQSIRTIRHVEAGEELTHSYIDIAGVRSKRRAALADRYYFHCECRRCVRDDEDSNVAGSFEQFLERDRDGCQIPEEILNPEFKEEEDIKPSNDTTPTPPTPTESSSTSTSTTISPVRLAALNRANKLWLDATRIHMADHTATSPDAIALEESRRCRLEQTYLSSSLQLRLEHLHPYALPIVANYSKLLHVALLNGDYSGAAHACEQLCRKYRVIYGSDEIRRVEMARWSKRIEQERRTMTQPTDSTNNTTASSTAVDDADDDDDDDEPDCISGYPSSELPTHPLLGLQLYTLASIYAELKQIRRSIDTFKAAMTILAITHGSEHPLLHRLREELSQQEQAAAKVQA